MKYFTEEIDAGQVREAYDWLVRTHGLDVLALERVVVTGVSQPVAAETTRPTGVFFDEENAVVAVFEPESGALARCELVDNLAELMANQSLFFRLVRNSVAIFQRYAG